MGGVTGYTLGTDICHNFFCILKKRKIYLKLCKKTMKTHKNFLCQIKKLHSFLKDIGKNNIKITTSSCCLWYYKQN
jgi:hypothetical protein